MEKGYVKLYMKVSIIIPVYNCDQSIKQSIKSVQEQTIKDLEIICVNDGSTDRSAEVIRQLQEEDSRIILYEQDNQGSGAARNLGLDHASGEFIAFLDADDYYLDADALENMFDACKKHQVSVCGTCVRIERGGVPVPDKGFQPLIDASRNHEILLYQDFQFDYGYYGFIFERTLICDNKFRFPLYRRFQDPVFFVRVMQAAGKFCFIDKALYVYRAPNVLSRFGPGNAVDLLRGLSDNLRFAAEHNLSKLYAHTVERIEEEYADVICHNLSVDSIACLIELNNFIRNKSADTKYVIKPLKNILNSVSESENWRRKEWIGKLDSCTRIYPYGAGKTCSDFLQYLMKHSLLQKVTGILVSSLDDNPNKLQDIPIIEINAYQHREGDLIVVTAVGIYQKEISAVLEEMGIDNYCVLRSCVDLSC